MFHFDCYWMEAFEWCNFTWDPATFPDPAGMLKRYHDRGLKICVWINPYIGQKSPLFQEGMKKGFLLKRRMGMCGRRICGRREWDWWISPIRTPFYGIRKS